MSRPVRAQRVAALLLVKDRPREALESLRMSEDQPITEVASNRARCTGDESAPHEPVELVLATREVVTCPRCGRRFRRAAPPDRTDPAVWPKGD